MIIYKITNKINGKIYIGQDSKNNPKYLGSGTYIKRAIKKYGKENFTKEILQECKTIDELNKQEIYWIDKLNSTDKTIGYNITIGGLGSLGYKHSIETRKKMSINTKNSPKFFNSHSPQTIEKMKNTLKGKPGVNKGKKFSTETRKKMSDAKKGKTPWNKGKKYKLSIESLKNKPNVVGKNNPFYGKKHTIETKEKMRKKKPIGFGEKIKMIRLGKKMSNETKLKISNKLKNRIVSTETRKKMSDAQKTKLFKKI